MRVLFLGDIVGKPGRRVVKNRLPGLIQELNLDLVIANAENAAGGFGLTLEVAGELFSAGIDVLTMGNHTWKNREIYQVFQRYPQVIRKLIIRQGLGKGMEFLRQRTDIRWE